ncbi:MAG: intermembrane phospholipid transport protein YdbH family protein [Planctomycetota bacterium]|jgi:hypothetical protein
MKRLRTWLVRLIGLALLVALVAAVVGVFMARTIARTLVSGQLEAIGIEVASLDVERVGLHEIRLGRLDLGPRSWLTAGTVAATYEPAELLEGRVETVEVTGAVWTVRVVDGEVDWGVPRSDATEGDVLDLPFDHVTLDSCTLRLVIDDDVRDVAVSGTVSRLDPHGATADLVLGHAGTEVEVDGQVGFGTGGLSGQADLVLTKGSLGSLPLEDGGAAIALSPDGTLAIDDLHWSMGEYGHFRADPFSIDLQEPVVAAELDVEAAALGPWLMLLSNGRAHGEGTLRGRLEVGYDRRLRQPLSFGEGLLEAEPASGWVVIGGDEIRELLEASDPRFRDPSFSDDVGDRIVLALKDFAFTVLRLQFLEEHGDTILRIELAGRGRAGVDPIEIGSLTLNIRGFADYLYLAVMLGKEFNP